MEILVVPTNKFIDNSSYRSIKDLINQEGLFKERAKMEVDSSYLQIIPYIIVYKDSQVFAYSRLKGGNESRLHNKISIGIGGHVERLEDNISCWDTLHYNVNKELFEELNIETTHEFLDVSLVKGQTIYDPSNEVGKVHLGLPYKVDCSGREVSARETDKISGKFYNIHELYSYLEKDTDRLETWSRILLERKIV